MEGRDLVTGSGRAVFLEQTASVNVMKSQESDFSEFQKGD